MVTISDVAARAGVGAGTVSRVLNGSPRVSEETRSKVIAVIDELGYRPNPMARGLSRGRCQTLGAVVPFFTQASAVERMRGVAAALDDSRYDLMLFNVETPVHRDEFLATLTRRDR
ncbi:MAG: LacI family transcriptional regulator, partial [Acidimicrobiales bacterium]|nr:LacI family transcriptional regulator [Acidimicrobiales bacterium]